MDRLSRQSPATKLTEDQRARLAELDSVYKAKIAEADLRLRGDARAAAIAGDEAKAESFHEQYRAERAKLEAELETKKDKIRNPA